MTRPIFEPTTQREIRKGKWGINQLERRPVPISEAAANTAVPTAVGAGNLESRPLNAQCGFELIGWAAEHDDVFGYDVISGVEAKYITITPGTYRTEAVVFWSTDFGGLTFPFISQYAYFPDAGTENQLAALSMGPAFDDEQGIIYGQQFTTAEMDHHAMASTHVFSWEEDDFNEPIIGIGVGLYAGGPGKSWGAMLAISQLSPYKFVTQTITS